MSGKCCIQMSHKRLYKNIKRCRLRCDHSGSRISNKRLQFPSLAKSEMPFIGKQLFSSLAIPERNARCQGWQEKKTNPEMNKINEQFSDIFNEIGTIRDNKNEEDFFSKFSMKPGAIPVAQRLRQVAYYLQEPLKK